MMFLLCVVCLQAIMARLRPGVAAPSVQYRSRISPTSSQSHACNEGTHDHGRTVPQAANSGHHGLEAAGARGPNEVSFDDLGSLGLTNSRRPARVNIARVFQHVV